MSENVNYSQCWEDPLLLIDSLSISNEDILLSITSGGDNSLALLLEKPKELVSIDLNSSQNYLLELKIASSKALIYEEFLEFLGVKMSSDRLALFEKVRRELPVESRLWWEAHISLIKEGVINVGRFEIFLNSFRKYILPLIHSKKTVEEFLSIADLSEQEEFYEKKWRTKRWRLLFRLFSGRFVLNLFARQKGAFKHVDSPRTGNIYFERFEKNSRVVPIQSNYFMHYCLEGKYRVHALPLYLEEKGYESIRSSHVQLNIVTNNLFNYLRTISDNYFSKFSLSDIFEFLSEKENAELWKEIIRTAKPGAVIVYWNNLVSRSYPEELSDKIFYDKKDVEELGRKDRAFFYGSFHINKVLK